MALLLLPACLWISDEDASLRRSGGDGARRSDQEGDADADADGDGDADADGDSDTDDTYTDSGPRDADGDGYDQGDDCDDADQAVHPGGSETCLTEWDDNCDGAANEADAYGCSELFEDGDGDGYGDDASECLCEPKGPFAVTMGGDCDDDDPNVSPAVTEVCEDGIDNDCDGGAPGCGPSGTLDLSSSDARLLGEDPGDYAGSVLAVGDVDGDGIPDVLVGAVAASTVYVVGGTVTGSYDLSAASARLVDPLGGSAGYAIATGDIDGDGSLDVVVGAPSPTPEEGAAYLVRGPVSTISLASADGVLSGEDRGDSAGSALACGDLDGDGAEDVLVGAYLHDGDGSNSGAAYLVAGPISGARDLSAADAELIGDAADHYLSATHSPQATLTATALRT